MPKQSLKSLTSGDRFAPLRFARDDIKVKFMLVQSIFQNLTRIFIDEFDYETQSKCGRYGSEVGSEQVVTFDQVFENHHLAIYSEGDFWYCLRKQRAK